MWAIIGRRDVNTYAQDRSNDVNLVGEDIKNYDFRLKNRGEVPLSRLEQFSEILDGMS